MTDLSTTLKTQHQQATNQLNSSESATPRMIVDKQVFVDALSMVGRAVSTHSMIPALAGIHLVAETGAVTLTATDGDISIQARIEAEVEQGGVIVIPGRLLAEVARQLPPGNIQIDSPESGSISIECGSTSLKLRLLPADDFPSVRRLDGSTVEVPSAEFKETVDQVARSASRDETRPHLTGILLSIDGNRLRSVATDSYRLAVRTTEIDTPVDQRIEANVPARALQEAVRIADAGDRISITLTERQIAFASGSTMLVSRLIDGQFPDFEQLIPDSFDHELDVDVSELHDAVKRASLLAQRNTPLKISLREGELEVSAQTADIGEAHELIPAPEFTGEDLEIGFNPDFLREGFDSVHTERARFKLISPFRPGLIVAGEADEFMYLVMPIRLDN